MRSAGILSTLIFGAAVGAAWPAVSLLVGPLLGASGALGLYLLAVAVAYVTALAPRGARRVRGALAGLALAFTVGVLAPNLASVVAGAALVVAVCRGVVVWPGPRVRTLTLEILLGSLGLLLARWLAGGDSISVGLAIWGYFVVQSAFFCVRAPATPGIPEMDPFDLAVRRAEQLLAEEV